MEEADLIITPRQSPDQNTVTTTTIYDADNEGVYLCLKKARGGSTKSLDGEIEGNCNGVVGQIYGYSGSLDHGGNHAKIGGRTTSWTLPFLMVVCQYSAFVLVLALVLVGGFDF